MELTFRGFIIWDFGVSNVEPQHTIVPEFRKVKGCGTNISGFRVFGVSKFKQQNTTIPEIVKRNERGTNISGFQDLGFQMSNYSTQQFSNYER
jgi:hypothetical protein